MTAGAGGARRGSTETAGNIIQYIFIYIYIIYICVYTFFFANIIAVDAIKLAVLGLNG